jgi:hypothetical protein
MANQDKGETTTFEPTSLVHYAVSMVIIPHHFPQIVEYKWMKESMNTQQPPALKDPHKYPKIICNLIHPQFSKT